MSEGLFDDALELIKCPCCGAIAGFDDYDCLGAEWGNLFCNSCNREIAPDGDGRWVPDLNSEVSA